MQVRLVRRPSHVGSGRLPIYPIDQLLQTVDRPTHALQIPFGRRRPATVITALKRLAERRGFRLRHQRRTRYVLAWVERRDA